MYYTIRYTGDSLNEWLNKWYEKGLELVTSSPRGYIFKDRCQEVTHRGISLVRDLGPLIKGERTVNEFKQCPTCGKYNWMKWSERKPKPGEAGYAIFRNEITGKYNMQVGTIVSGQFWYDETPIAWQPTPEIPEIGELADLSEQLPYDREEEG